MKERALKIIGFQVDQQVDEFFQKRADEELCSKSAIIRRVLVDYWRKHEAKAAKKQSLCR